MGEIIVPVRKGRVVRLSVLASGRPVVFEIGRLPIAVGLGRE